MARMARTPILPFAAAVAAALLLGSPRPEAQTATGDPFPGAFPRPVVPVAPVDPLDEPLPAAIATPPVRTPRPAPAAPEAALPRPAPDAPVSMIADSIRYDSAARTITAEGSVEIQYENRVLRATRIVYDEDADTIRATGPLTLVDPDIGVVFASGAAATIDFEEAAIAEARLLVSGLLQLAAAEVRRTEGRYTILDRTIASACEVCPGGGPPTWAIRAGQIVRDEETRQIHFRNAVLEVFGVPVAWLPYLRIPEPTVERASGVLAPVFRQSSLYGLGFKLPYYRVLGPHADLTLTPFVTQRGGTLIEGEYRRRFARGALDLTASLAPDGGLERGGARGTIAATGFHELGGGFRAELDAEAASDARFLSQYDYSDADRLTSTARIVRFRAQDRFELGAVAFQSLRSEEDRSQIPLILPEFRFRRIEPGALAGGRLGLEADAVGILREGGRDVLRAGATGDWRRDAVVGPGLVAAAETGLSLDLWSIQDDPDAADRVETRAAPWARAELRWPLLRTTARATHVLEPVVDLAWSDAVTDGDIPNEDSLLPEFDETNLFALDRFPGRDRIETGLRANVGLSYSLFDDAGRNATATFGRVIRFSDRDQFAAGTGLAGVASDWVGAVEVGVGPGFGAINRIRFDDDFDVTRNEFSVVYETPQAGLAASWYYLAADPDLEVGPQPETSEVALAGRYRVLPNWEIRGNWRYDVASESTLRAGGGITYGNECAEFDVSVTRRFVTAGDVPATTSFAFGLRFVGLGGTATREWPRRTCNG